MKIKPLFLLPGAIALMLSAVPLISAFTPAAMADPGMGGGPGAGMYGKGRGMHGGKGFNRLNLTDAQKAQMQKIREETRQQVEAVLTEQQKEQLRQAKQNRQNQQNRQNRQNQRWSQLNLTADQQARMKAIHEEAQRKMEAVLTEQQKQQLQQMRQQKQQRLQSQPAQ